MLKKTKILKTLTLIILIKVIYLINSPVISSQSNPEFCGKFSVLFAGKKSIGRPESIAVIVPDSNKWYKRIIRALYIGGGINKDLKKYQNAKVVVNYKKEISCKYNAKIRIHGGGKDHLNYKLLTSSIRVKLLDGSINNIYNFALIYKNARNFDEEIFSSTLFKNLGFLTPLYFKVRTTINTSPAEEYLFVEMPTMEMAKNQNRNNGLFIAGNNNNFSENKTDFKYRRSLVLSRLKEAKGISNNNKEVILNALSKMNFVYLNSLGIGNGKNCCDSSNKIDLTKKMYVDGNIYLNFQNNNKVSQFNLIMSALNAFHGMALEDRIFFYDPTFDEFEPIYYDGNSNILSSNTKKNNYPVFEFEKKHIIDVNLLIKNLDLIKLEEDLKINGLDLNNYKLSEILDRIIKNLEIINNFKTPILNSYDPLYAPNYFQNHFDKNLSFKILFGGKNNKFEICNIYLSDCKLITLSDKLFYKVLKEKFFFLKKYKNKVLYIGKEKNNYISNIKPRNNGIKNFKKKQFNNFKLFYNTSDNNIMIDRNNKVIDFTQFSKNDRFVLIGNIDQWSLNFIGNNKNHNQLSYKRDKNMLGGCITILNSKLKDLKIDIRNAYCPNAIELLNTDGHIKDIKIEESSLDGFDAEFSNLEINLIKVNQTYGECIGVKRGNYIIKKAILINCGDKAISSGEHSSTQIKNSEISRSESGIIAKDSSEVTVNKLDYNGGEKCIHSYRGKFNYSGSTIFLNKKKTNCGNGKILRDNNSEIIIKN